ncbi:MAG: LytTR family DNA-binding domain-containing protein [Bacteroidetes bacterium]|nr:LytTR family DNA-binding domain-containing protein [Bacteroidota bacterium]
MKINCIAIDDEPLALDIIKDYCDRVPFLNLIRTFDNAMESIEFIRNNQIDLIFLDIQMEELTGIQLLNALKHRPYVIFTTAYDNYAIQGFDLDVMDYMLKPISFERFVKGVDKVYEKMKLDMLAKSGTGTDGGIGSSLPYFFVKTETRMEKVRYADVLYVEGMGDYWRIFTTSKKIMSLLNYKKLEELLPSSQFVRVHKSFIVALDKIESIERNRIKIADRLIPISETFKKSFFDLIEKRQ